jgi:hypothetical protein
MAGNSGWPEASALGGETSSGAVVGAGGIVTSGTHGGTIGTLPGEPLLELDVPILFCLDGLLHG